MYSRVPTNVLSASNSNSVVICLWPFNIANAFLTLAVHAAAVLGHYTTPVSFVPSHF